MDKKPFIHPYIPNSVPEVKKKMLAEIGVKDIEELYEDIPPKLRLKRDLNLPEPLLSELDFRRHMEAILDRNISCAERPSFLGEAAPGTMSRPSATRSPIARSS